MSILENINLNQLSEQELKALISKSKRQIKKLSTKPAEVLNSRDADVVAVADAVRQLAKAKRVSPVEALTVVAKSLRISVTASRKPRAETPIKYRDPQDPSKTWKGFGKRPLWLVQALQAGRRLEDFKI